MDLTTRPIVSRSQATAAATELFMQAAIRVLMDSSYSADKIGAAVTPFFAVDFSRDSVTRIGNYKFSRFLNRLRGSLLDRTLYRALMNHISIPMIDETLAFSPELEQWRVIIARYNLTESISLPDWIPIINHLAAALIATPQDLALWSHAEISLLAANSPNADAILSLFRATSVVCAPVPSATPESSWQLLSSAHALAGGLRVSTVAETSCARAHATALDAMELPGEFSHLGPAAKIRCLAESSADKAQLFRFLNTGAQVNILRQVQDSLKSVASGIQCYASFCDLIQVNYFPPSTDTVLRWSTLFSPGRSFSHYLAHLPKACQLMNLPLTWITPSVRGVAKGLANAQDVSFRFDNFIQKDLLVRLIRAETLSSEIGRLFYLAYLFLLRVPSEGLPIRRASIGDIIVTKSPQSEKALMGIRFIGRSPRLILKLKKRKLNKTGAIMMRPCFCDGEGLVPAGLCPIHDFWPIVQRSFLPGEQLFPALQGKNLNRILKAIMARLNVEFAEKYSTKAFRRGAAMDIMASGSTLAQIMRSAGWHSQAFRAYLTFQMEEECNMKAIFASSNRSKQKPKRKSRQDSARDSSPRAMTIADVSSECPSTSSTSLSGGEL